MAGWTDYNDKRKRKYTEYGKIKNPGGDAVTAPVKYPGVDDIPEPTKYPGEEAVSEPMKYPGADDISEPVKYPGSDEVMPTREDTTPGEEIKPVVSSGSRPTYTSQYQSEIDDILKKILGYGDYESPYAERIDKELSGIEGYGPYESKYGENIDALLKSILDRDKFSYDMESDPAWQSYKKQYTREGQRSMQDTLGQYAAMTGGMPSTAAMTAAQQAGDYYSAKMTDKIPELYKLAYSMYTDEGDRLLQNLNALRGLDSDDYAKYSDAYTRMLQGLSALQGQDSTAYGRWADAYSRLLQGLDTTRALEGDSYSRYRDSVGDWERDRDWDYKKQQDEKEWDFKQRQYDDTRGDTEWEKAFKERQYGDSREDTEWEKQFKERQYDDERTDTDWEKQFKERQYGDERGDTEWEKAFKERQYGDERGDVDYKRQKETEASTVYAYRDGGGEPYTISSDKGLKFIDSASPGDTMTGGDGSMWTKNPDGSVTITKGGTTWRIAAPAGSGGGYSGSYSGGGYEEYGGDSAAVTAFNNGDYSDETIKALLDEGFTQQELINAGYTGDYFRKQSGGSGNPFTQAPQDVFEYMEDRDRRMGISGKEDSMPLDEESLMSLGIDDPEELAQMIDDGVVKMYQSGGKWHFRKVGQPR